MFFDDAKPHLPNHHKINHRRSFVCLWSLATTKYTVVDWTLGVRKESKHRVQEECEQMLKTRCVRGNYISGPGSHTQGGGLLGLVLEWCVRLQSPAVSAVLRELQGFTPERGGRNWCTTAFMLFPDLSDLFSCPSNGCGNKKELQPDTRLLYIPLPSAPVSTLQLTPNRVEWRWERQTSSGSTVNIAHRSG